jgi:methionyl-tRNA formyltransferase
MRLEGVVFLAANTARSKAYAQAMEAREIEVDTTLFFDEEGRERPGKTETPHGSSIEGTGIFLPDLRIPLADTCRNISGVVQNVVTGKVNDPLISSALSDLKPKLIIYSGFGGQIVGSELLEQGTPFLHMHSGWLPDFRGSTTIYYSLLEKGSCGVSAILLMPEIDVGPIVARRSYPPPPPGINIDYIYDSAIRSDLLVDVLSDWSRSGDFKDISEQLLSSGRTFYVIHPVLKHLALLSLEKTPRT